jgi:hypothetical protein
MKISLPQGLFFFLWLLLAALVMSFTGSWDKDNPLFAIFYQWLLKAVILDLATKGIFKLWNVDLEIRELVHLTIWWYSAGILYFTLGIPYLFPLAIAGAIFLLLSFYCFCCVFYFSICSCKSYWKNRKIQNHAEAADLN